MTPTDEPCRREEDGCPHERQQEKIREIIAAAERLARTYLSERPDPVPPDPLAVAAAEIEDLARYLVDHHGPVGARRLLTNLLMGEAFRDAVTGRRGRVGASALSKEALARADEAVYGLFARDGSPRLIEELLEHHPWNEFLEPEDVETLKAGIRKTAILSLASCEWNLGARRDLMARERERVQRLRQLAFDRPHQAARIRCAEIDLLIRKWNRDEGFRERARAADPDFFERLRDWVREGAALMAETGGPPFQPREQLFPHEG